MSFRTFALAVFLLPILIGRAAAQDKATPAEVFERRIAPIFKSPQPSSCVQCHLAGVDLKNYILSSSEKTFRSLRDQGLIDLDRPLDSKILRLIQMGAEDRRGAALIHEKTRKAEYEAFAAWVQACCADPKLRDAPKLDDKERAGPTRPVEVVRHARKDRLLESFERNVWAMRFRCMNCHIEGNPQNDKLRKEHGDRVAWFKKAGPEATMEYLLQSRLIDYKEPDKSLLLLKPLNLEKHSGGVKFLIGDQGYKAFRSWIEDVVAVKNDRYTRAADLPPRSDGVKQFGSEIWLKLSDTPPAWADKLLQVNVYAWDADRKAWETTPIATSDRGVWGGGKLWQHTLTLQAAKGSKRAEEWQRGKPTLRPGRYLVKVYVDGKNRLKADWQAALGEADLVGQSEVESRWPEGYQAMTSINAARVRAPRGEK
jgi:hypothetical protein